MSLILRRPPFLGRASKDGRARGVCAGAALALGFVSALASGAAAQEALRPYTAIDDGIPASLTGAKGDAARGRAIVANRQVGLCLLCHSGPFPEERLQGNLAPDMRGAGRRWTEAQLRLRIVDASRLNPDTIMPPYYRVDRLHRVSAAFRGKPILTAEQIEDVVAFLVTLKDGP
jgi:sulfur-oxidizing protein SoxX